MEPLLLGGIGGEGGRRWPVRPRLWSEVTIKLRATVVTCKLITLVSPWL